MSARVLFLVWLATLSMVGCAQPRTQVVVVIDGDDSVRARTNTVRLEVWRFDGVRGERLRDENPRPGAGRDVPWPFQTVLAPLGNDASRRYEVSATALDRDGQPIVVARAISGYTPGDTRVLRLFLDTRCESRTCAAADATCREGVCVDVEILPSNLPTLASYGADAGPDAPDAPRVAMDAPGTDAYVPPGVDADLDAFSEPPDAHVLPGEDAYSPDAFMGTGRFTSIAQLPLPDIAPDTLFNVGWSVATSDGNAVAVGAPGAGDYLYDVTRPFSPPQRLHDTACGQSAVINSDGDFVGFGCPSESRAIAWSRPPVWASMDIGLGVGAGHALAMNESGSVLACGGHDEIYIHAASVAVGNAIVGIDVFSLDLSDDGTLLVAGVRNLGADRDEVRTFTVSGTTITPVGDPILNRGAAVAISGDGSTLVVGENLADRAAVYRRVAGAWVADFAVNGPAGSLFGISVAVNQNGTRIAIGASASDSTCLGVCEGACLACAPTGGGSGAVYVYDGSGAPQNYVRLPVTALGSAFGTSVALNRSGSRLVVGAPSHPDAGAVYVVE